ncbi:MAG: hypothetical protein UY85_C0011G0019 [Candidatus Peribacteria bacterium GW2011_GWB1_54_5]|nr:MAG: hypothetical protein UY85_C0011G0019 [Candidatus Peribacteria bacterium GW2011_GWB1_54_5]
MHRLNAIAGNSCHGSFCSYFCRVGSGFACPLETGNTTAAPADFISLEIRERHDRVVLACMNAYARNGKSLLELLLTTFDLLDFNHRNRNGKRLRLCQRDTAGETRLFLSAPRTRIPTGSLPTDRELAQAVTALEFRVRRLDARPQLGKPRPSFLPPRTQTPLIFLGKFVCLRTGIDAEFFQNLPGAGLTNALNVRKSNMNRLVAREWNTCDAQHSEKKVTNPDAACGAGSCRQYDALSCPFRFDG